MPRSMIVTTFLRRYEMDSLPQGSVPLAHCCLIFAHNSSRRLLCRLWFSLALTHRPHNNLHIVRDALLSILEARRTANSKIRAIAAKRQRGDPSRLLVELL